MTTTHDLDTPRVAAIGNYRVLTDPPRPDLLAYARVDDEVDGSGIGLSTCRRVVEAHGGRIGLTASPYGGTCAWFELPA